MQCRLPRRIGKLTDGVNYVEYIQSSGTQWINTLIKPSYNTRVVLDISDLTSVDTMVLGSKNADSSVANDQFAIYRRKPTAIRSDYFGTNATATISDTTQRGTIDKNANVVTMYGTTLTNTAVSSGTGSYNMYLFALNTADDSSKTFPSSFKLYSCQIYNGGNLVRDFYPALATDGVACLYDKVSKAYFYNAGTGTFTAGPSISGGGSSGGDSTAYAVTIDASAWNVPISDITINGTKYTSATTVAAKAGTVVTINLNSTNVTYTAIRLNGTIVKPTSSSTASYSFALASNTTITGSSGAAYYVDITTE